MTLELPSLQQAELAWTKVHELLDDLHALVQVLEVRLKGVVDGHAEATTVDLATARNALAAGTALAVQVRYLHRGRPWCDTLVRSGEGVRLVRIEIPTPPG
jgi:hypothetical protein